MGIPVGLPRNIKLFVSLWWASVGIGIVEVFLMPPPDANAVRLGFTPLVQAVFASVVMAIILAICLPFFWLAVWRRKNWARWVLFCAFVISLPLSFVDKNAFRTDHLPLTIAAFFGTLIEVVAFVLLFTGDAKAWFKSDISH